MFNAISLAAVTLVLCGSTLAVSAALQFVVVEVSVPGRSPEQLEVEVAVPLERAFSKLPLVQRVKSSTSDGFCRIEVSYQASPSPASIAQVKAAVEATRIHFPSAAEVPIVSVKLPSIQ